MGLPLVPKRLFSSSTMSPACVNVVTTILQEEGYATARASTAEDALRLVHSGLTPDAVLLDLRMPGMGGLGFLLALRAQPGGRRHPRGGRYGRQPARRHDATGDRSPGRSTLFQTAQHRSNPDADRAADSRPHYVSRRDSLAEGKRSPTCPLLASRKHTWPTSIVPGFVSCSAGLSSSIRKRPAFPPAVSFHVRAV